MSQDINLVANGKVPQFLDESALFWWCFVVVREGWCEMLQGKVFFFGGGGHSESLHMNPNP